MCCLWEISFLKIDSKERNSDQCEKKYGVLSAETENEMLTCQILSSLDEYCMIRGHDILVLAKPLSKAESMSWNEQDMVLIVT